MDLLQKVQETKDLEIITNNQKQNEKVLPDLHRP